VIGCSRAPSSQDVPAPDGVRDAPREIVAIVADYCGGCHAPPRPQSHTPAEWPAVVARMQEHRSRAGMAPIPVEELHKITDYLQQLGRNA
jgi:hypothetical protein